uniref:Secreted protein n=1 Tax=Haemonchus contortus TaxID=6289 RepID=A0A7I4Y2Z5_HAECO
MAYSYSLLVAIEIFRDHDFCFPNLAIGCMVSRTLPLIGSTMGFRVTGNVNNPSVLCNYLRCPANSQDSVISISQQSGVHDSKTEGRKVENESSVASRAIPHPCMLFFDNSLINFSVPSGRCASCFQSDRRWVSDIGLYPDRAHILLLGRLGDRNRE